MHNIRDGYLTKISPEYLEVCITLNLNTILVNIGQEYTESHN